jgi:serpin B
VGGWKRGTRLGVAAVAAALLAACGPAGATPLVYRGNVVPIEVGSLGARDVAEAQTAFAADLLRVVCGQNGTGNVLLSPTSAAEALGLLYPAAGGRTVEAFRAVLHLPVWSPALVAALREHTRALDGLRYAGNPRDDDAPDSLQMSNHLWTSVGLQPHPRYLDDIATAFDADVRSLDFAGDPGGATDRINATVDAETHGIIETLFDQPLPRATTAVLTDALYLKARWAVPFTGTQPAPFAAPSGKTTVGMMSGASGSGRTAAGWQSVELPYRDGSLTAVAVLPPAGTDPCAVNAPTLGALAAAAPGQVDVRLPRLRLEQTHQLLEPLATLGLPVEGDYPALGRNQLRISQVVQKTFLKVDEQGTEAAAATGVGVAVSARVSQRVVSFDRPFLLLLTDTKMRSPLFAAVVHDPSA